MNILVITGRKIKITLTKKDINSIGMSSLPTSAEDTGRLFRALLPEIKERTGFSPEEGRTLVQLYPTSGGGCELFVTSLRRGRGGEERAPVSGSLVFRFPSVADLLRAAYCVSPLCGAALCRPSFDYGCVYLSIPSASRAARLFFEFGDPVPERLSPCVSPDNTTARAVPLSVLAGLYTPPTQSQK